MHAVILAYKFHTETMAMCMARIRRTAALSLDTAMTYAGRLDPMAEGLVLFLCGDMRYFKERFLHVSKSYTVKFFLGYVTDTYDVLGMPKVFMDERLLPVKKLTRETIESFCPPGNFSQHFPKFSSRRVLGKPLFYHALHGLTVPEQTHAVSITSYGQLYEQKIPTSLFLKSMIASIQKVDGTFRQSESIHAWNALARTFPREITEYSIHIECSAGFYVRQWVHDLGLFLSTGAVTSGIIRDTIGVFTMSMLNGESYRVFTYRDPEIQNLTE